MKNVALYNLGCKVNAYEMEGMRQALADKGFHIVPYDEKADIYIVNTCTVTNIADRKSRQLLHRAKQLNPDAVVVAVGCYVQTGLEAIEKDDSIDLAVGNNRKKDIGAILEEFLAAREGAPNGKSRERESGETAATMRKLQDREITEAGGCQKKENNVLGRRDKTLQMTTVLNIGHTHEYEEMQVRQAGEHTRAYIKIQDGCNQFCSYCVIPYARGRVRSRNEEDIVKEIQGLVDAGYREVVLTGIHISSYGTDFSGNNGANGLIDLTERIHEIKGLDRIRLGSLEPRIITRETARRLAALPKLCAHFHLSLQSGCDATLKRMNRHYTTGEYYDSVRNLREYFHSPAITTDVIVGFPGETQEEFSCTKAFVEKTGFYELHVFKYSRRAGTAADKMPDQVSDQIKTKRSSDLIALGHLQSREFRRHYIGGTAEVLLEERLEAEGDAFWVGLTKDYVKVAVKEKEGRALKSNQLVQVTITGFLTDEILVGQ